MIQVHGSELSALIVALVAALLALAASALLRWRRNQAARTAMSQLIASVGEHGPARLATVEAFLSALGSDAATVAERAGAIERGERRLYQHFIDLHVGDKHAEAAVFDTRVWELLAPLLAARPESATELIREGSTTMPTTLEDALAHNARLEEELATTRSAMDDMLKEYAQLFSRTSGDANGTPAESGAPAAGRPEHGAQPIPRSA